MGPDSAVQVPGWRPCGSDYVLCKIFSREVGMQAAIDDVRLMDVFFIFFLGVLGCFYFLYVISSG